MWTNTERLDQSGLVQSGLVWSGLIWSDLPKQKSPKNKVWSQIMIQYKGDRQTHIHTDEAPYCSLGIGCHIG